MSKNILVIGGSSGIGKELVSLLLNEGNTVYAACRNTENVPQGAKTQTFDVLSDNAEELEIPEQLDGLVYCPGTINLKPFHRIKTEEFQHEMEVNFFGAVKVIQAALKSLKASENAGSVVLFSTVAVAQGMPFHAGIASAKGAVEGLTKSLAAEYAPKVRFNAIAPSLTNTPLAEKLLANEQKMQASADRHPLKKVGQPKDLAEMAHFLLSEKSAWITGSVIGVDGGMATIRPI
ncbi:MAG: SDR family NAD(P)-dependent oxidoreductase [Luteibaculaceae bacterium]